MVGVRDVLLLVGSAVFTALGLLMLLHGDDPRTAVAVTVFFGGCTAVAAWLVNEKTRLDTGLRTEGEVGVLGSTRIPVDPTRPRIGAVGLFVGGSILAWAGQGLGGLFVLCALVMAVTGALLGVALVTGRTGGEWIAFEPEGLRFGNPRYSYLVAWDNLAAVQLAELSGNPLLALHVRSVDHLLATVQGEPVAQHRARLAKAVQSSLQWQGVPLVLWPSRFGLETGHTLRAVERYVADPASRAELVAQGALPGPE